MFVIECSLIHQLSWKNLVFHQRQEQEMDTILYWMTSRTPKYTSVSQLTTQSSRQPPRHKWIKIHSFFFFRSSEIPWLFWLINSELAQITFDKDQLINKLKIKKKERKKCHFFFNVYVEWKGWLAIQPLSSTKERLIRLETISGLNFFSQLTLPEVSAPFP